MATRLRFTDAKVRDLLAAADGTTGRAEYQDETNPYLYARVSAGRCAWSAVVWSPQQRKTVRHPLGTSHELNVKAARDAAAAVVADEKAGVNPGRERKAKRATAGRARATVRDLLETYIATCEAEGEPLRPRTVDSYRDNLPALLGEYFDRPIDDIETERLKAMIVERMRKRIVKNPKTGTKREVGSATNARVACDALSRLCAVNRIPDPSEELRTSWRAFPQYKTRDGRLGEMEAQAMYAWLNDMQASDGRADNLRRQARMLMVALVTGWRIHTIRQVCWEHIKWTTGTIELPARIMKNKKPLTVPLYGTLADLLRPHKKSVGLIFPNSKGGLSSLKDEFISQLPYPSAAHDARKVVTFILATREGVLPFVHKMLAGHAPGKRDVTYTNYLATTPIPDRIRHMRAGCDAMDKFYRAKLGDKKTVRAMDALSEPRRLEMVARRYDNTKAYRKRLADKRALLAA